MLFDQTNVMSLNAFQTFSLTQHIQMSVGTLRSIDNRN